jgi:hypothetical protein
MNLLERWRKKSPRATRRPVQARRRLPLSFEALECRLTPATKTFVVPVSTPADNVTTFHSLGLAITPAAPNGLVVTVEPGASNDLVQPINIARSGITIQGDPNVPAAILPSYQLAIFTSNVTLKNLNISSLAIGQATADNSLIFHNTVSNCLVGPLSAFGRNVTLVQNTFMGGVRIIEDSQNTQVDIVQNNLFQSTAGTLLELDAGFGAQITGNTFNGDGSTTAIRLANCNGNPPGPTAVANNTISLTGDQFSDDVGILVFQVGSGLQSFVQINDNAISTQNLGTGIRMTMTQDNEFSVIVFGNDFHGNRVGVSITGDGTTGVASQAHIDMGGGNDFRSFSPPASATGAAIVLQNAPTTTVFAERNLFTGDPTKVVFASSGTIDVSSFLVGDAAFTQALYTRVFGRVASQTEILFWVKSVSTQGRTGVANSILRSSEGLGPIVDQFYLKFLGRQSDAAGRAAWIGFLQNGGTQEQMETAFLVSPEYLSHIDTDFVQSLYINIFGRTGSASELAFWNNNIQKLGLTGVANGFVLSAENRANTITRYFQTLLHRTPSSAEIAPTVNSTTDLLTVELGILSTTEFFNNG